MISLDRISQLSIKITNSSIFFILFHPSMELLLTSSVIVNLILFFFFYRKIYGKRRKIKLEKGNYQVSVVINKDLNMSKGKVLSQFGHAIDSLHEKLVEYPELVQQWRNSGSAKIALKGTQDELNKIYEECKKNGLIYARVFDAGRTQVMAGSFTVIAVGPATKKQLENVTSHLSLY